MKRRRPYNPFPGVPMSRRERMDEAAERDAQIARRNARQLDAQDARGRASAPAGAAPQEQNDSQGEKQNG
jgi:hypothetical protein